MLLSPVEPELFFQGRPGDPRIGEWVSPETQFTRARSKTDVVILGLPDDEGVALNRGRRGAKEGPDTIRRHLYRMAQPMDLQWEKHLRLWDWGNVIPGDSLEETHERALEATNLAAQSGAVLIALGGGHDFAAPNFAGFSQGLGGKMGLINIDPHLDVRPLDDGPHSGTPFRVLLDGGLLSGPGFVEFGIRANRNARLQYQYCREKKVTIVTLEQIRGRSTSVVQQFKSQLTRLKKGRSHLGVTLDMDCCSDAEGTSAAPVLGFSAWELYEIAQAAGANSAVKYLEIAEVAPPLDTNDRSARIAAEVIYGFLRARASKTGRSRR